MKNYFSPVLAYKSSGARWIKKKGLVILLESKKGRYYRLNTTASLIWDLCDGVHNEKYIASIIRQKFKINKPEELEQDIRKLILNLVDNGLLVLKKSKKSYEK